VAAQPQFSEQRLKAAFLNQFAQFVEWPPMPGASDLQLCVLEPNPFGAELEELARGETVGSRPVVVRRLDPVDPPDSCHVLFVSAQTTRGPEVLKAIATRPILTVGEGPRFLDDGGIIALRVVDRRVRFDIDTANAQRAGLRISSQLLSLAIVVRGRRP